jgi:hypothetical protein
VSELEETEKVAEDVAEVAEEGKAVAAESVNESEGVVVAAAGKGINASRRCCELLDVAERVGADGGRRRMKERLEYQRRRMLQE